MTTRRPKRDNGKRSKLRADDRDRGLFVISIAAELSGVHPQTLRMYERKGLLQPKRTQGRARRYSHRDIEHVQLIQALTQERGMNLAGVEMVMELTRELDRVRERMSRLERETQELRARVHEASRQNRTALVLLRDVQRSRLLGGR